MIVAHEKFDHPYEILSWISKWHKDGWVIKHLQIICRPAFTGDEWHVFAVLDKAGAT